MTQLRGPLAFYTVASELLDEIAFDLDSATGERPERVCVYPGSDIAWDECECGQLAAAVQRWYLSDNFPLDRFAAIGGAGNVTSACDAAYDVAELLISVTRCIAQPEIPRLAPPCAKLDQNAQETITEAYVVRTTAARVLCEMLRDDRIVDFVVREQRSRGHQGLCAGSDLTVLIALERGEALTHS